MAEFSDDETPLPSLEDFLDDTVDDLEISIGELSIEGTCHTGVITCHFLSHFVLLLWSLDAWLTLFFCCLLEDQGRTSTPKRARSILKNLDEASGAREGEFRGGKHDLTPSSKMAILPQAKRFEVGKRMLKFVPPYDMRILRPTLLVPYCCVQFVHS